MSENENWTITEFPELTVFEKSLATLAPRPANLARAALFFRAGEAAAVRASVNRRSWLRYGWPAAFAAMTAVTAVLLVVLCRRETMRPAPPASEVLPQTAAASAAPSVLPGRAPLPDSRLAGLLEYARLRDEIVRDGVHAKFVVSSGPVVDDPRPLSSGELLNRILSEE
jgi:hypothetical protein